MDFVSWSDNLSVGIKRFDDEHKQLVAYVNDLNNALKLGSASKTLEDILVRLVKYTIVHFDHEEKLMQKHNYPDYIKHKNEHSELTAQVNDFYERVKTGKATFSFELLTFLKDWLTNHILGSDMTYKEFFNSRGES